MSANDLLERAKLLSLTTTGRVTGKSHTVELWFAYHAGVRAVYVLAYPGESGNGTDWYQNALANPEVEIEVRGRPVKGTATPAPAAEREQAEQRTRDLFVTKYGGPTVSYWYGQESRLPLKIEIST